MVFTLDKRRDDLCLCVAGVGLGSYHSYRVAFRSAELVQKMIEGATPRFAILGQLRSLEMKMAGSKNRGEIPESRSKDLLPSLQHWLTWLGPYFCRSQCRLRCACRQVSIGKLKIGSHRESGRS